MYPLDAKNNQQDDNARAGLRPQPPALLYAGFDWLLAIGPMPELAGHRHPATVIGFGLDGDFAVRLADTDAWLATEAFVVPADAPGPAIRAQGRLLAFLFLPALCPVHCAIVRSTGGETDLRATCLSSAASLRELIADLARSPVSAGEAAVRLRSGLRRLIDTTGLVPPDPRIASVVDRVLAAPGRSSLASLAAEVSLSETHLLHLFKANTGLTLRRLRMWARTVRSIPLYAREGNLTNLAIAAGFTDSAHLSRNFKSLFGASPSAIMRHNPHFRIIADQHSRLRVQRECVAE